MNGSVFFFNNGGTEPTTPTIPTDGLVASYLLAGTAEDETGVYDGTEYGNTYVYDNERGVVASFDGVNDYIALPNIPWFPEFSYSIWVDKSSHVLDSNIKVIYIDRKYNEKFRYFVQYLDGYSFLERKADGKDNIYTIPFTDSDLNNTWNLFTLVHDNTTSYMYLNGELKSTFTNNGYYKDTSKTTYPPAIGAYLADNDRWYFDGKLSNLRIYNRAITQEEVAAIYNAKQGN